MTKQHPLTLYRKVSGLRPEEVARLFNVNKATIFRWEKEEPPIPAKRLADAERITGIPRQRLRPDIFGEAV